MSIAHRSLNCYLSRICNKIPVIHRYYAYVWSARLLEGRIQNILKEYSVDLLIIHSAANRESEVVYRQTKQNNIPVIVANHGSNKRLDTMRILRKLAYTADGLGLVSPSNIPERFREKATILLNGIDVDFFDPRKITCQGVAFLKRKLNISQQDYIIIDVARIVQTKGHLDILKTAVQLKKKELVLSYYWWGMKVKIQFLLRK